ncbi:MAG: alpha/beta hydrolase [Eubacteriales bacterium]
MKKLFKVPLMILFALVTLLIINSAVHHLLLKVEQDKIAPNGVIVEVNGHNMHIYYEGVANDKPTLVFLSGSATVAPVYDFKPLYSKLSDSYQIVVIEKAGYGYSDACDIPRDVDTIVDESRQALELAGIMGEYVLLPHSISGLEAIYWAQKYPDEINSIIGLDMALPDHYMNMDYEKISRIFAVGNVAKFLGLHRTFGFLYPLNNAKLDDEEIMQQKYLMYKNAVNNIYYIEGTYAYDNAIKIKDMEIPNIKIMFMVSDGTETTEDWIEITEKYAEQVDGQIVYYDCGHYIHYYEADDIVANIKEFLEE